MANQLTIKQVMAGFKTSDMTVWTWRKGTVNRLPLPHNISSTGRVTFNEPEVKAWAKKYGLSYIATAAKAEGTSVAKRGPKVTTKPASRRVSKAVPKSAIIAKNAKRVRRATA